MVCNCKISNILGTFIEPNFLTLFYISFHILRKPLAITTSVERELIDLMSTFTFDTTIVVLNDLENNVLCMVFLYA